MIILHLPVVKLLENIGYRGIIFDNTTLTLSVLLLLNIIIHSNAVSFIGNL